MNMNHIEMKMPGNGVTGAVLKIVAVVSMLTDHVAATILARMMMADDPTQFAFVSEHIDTMRSLYFYMRCIGRLAFPIYCFLLVEGFKYTRNASKYALRLLLFAFISEIPFDLAFQKAVWDMSYNNVFFTLFLGLIAMIGISFMNRWIALGEKDKSLYYLRLFVRSLLDVIVIFSCMFLAEVVLHTDYGAAGVIAIVIIYVLRSHPCIAVVVSTVLLSLISSELELFALPVVLLLYFYNGKRGRQMKYFFYAFYPVHLLVLTIICYFIGLGI